MYQYLTQLLFTLVSSHILVEHSTVHIHHNMYSNWPKVSNKESVTVKNFNVEVNYKTIPFSTLKRTNVILNRQYFVENPFCDY